MRTVGKESRGVYATLRSYPATVIGTSKRHGRGGRQSLPYAFTEQGVAMLSSVLRSQRAALVNVAMQPGRFAVFATAISMAGVPE